VTDPFELFATWFAEAQHGPLFDPTAVALASANKEGRPSVRMVLFRGIREGGFAFFTNYESRKSRDFGENPFAAMAFYWPHLSKQVRLEGRIELLSPEESDVYFDSRPLGSRITAIASRQSCELVDEAAFLEEIRQLERLAETQPIRRPPFWGGYKLAPEVFEFWIHQDDRRHIRIAYCKRGEEWIEGRLYP
jgi:pyridoxamine 5'-phosphate oxidase